MKVYVIKNALGQYFCACLFNTYKFINSVKLATFYEDKSQAECDIYLLTKSRVHYKDYKTLSVEEIILSDILC